MARQPPELLSAPQSRMRVMWIGMESRTYLLPRRVKVMPLSLVGELAPCFLISRVLLQKRCLLPEQQSRAARILTKDRIPDFVIDLVVTEYYNENPVESDFVVFLSDGAGNFNRSGSFTTDIQPSTLDVTDLNNDGKLDVAFAVSSKLTVRGDSSTAVLTFLGDGAANLNPGPDLTVGREPDSAVASDFNKVGHVDLVVRIEPMLRCLSCSEMGTEPSRHMPRFGWRQSQPKAIPME